MEAGKKLELTAELFDEQDGKPKYATDLEVIVGGRDYGHGKMVGPYMRTATVMSLGRTNNASAFVG
ncbi:MAG: hypothetical protein ABR568_09640 [Pyrinomonadaceae bacterium]